MDVQKMIFEKKVEIVNLAVEIYTTKNIAFDFALKQAEEIHAKIARYMQGKPEKSKVEIIK